MLSKIQQVFKHAWKGFRRTAGVLSGTQEKAAHSILNCKTGSLGVNLSTCSGCGHTETHNNSCRNRNCPNCQAVLKETWIDSRKAEVIDSPYFHVVFTVPAELNPLFYANQKLLYPLLHRACSRTLLELSSNRKYLGAVPGIIQVLHTWGQELNFHPHMHCIVSGGGLTADRKLKVCGDGFFIPARVLAGKFRGKFLDLLQQCHKNGELVLPESCSRLRNSYSWNEFRDNLYRKTWCPDIRGTFNGFGNAIEYLGRYTHRIAVTNARILKVTEETVTFTAKDYKNNSQVKEVTLPNEEFIRRMMLHVLPSGFQKIRYYGFLNNRGKKDNLSLIFRLQGHRKFEARFKGLSIREVIKAVWGHDISLCPKCGGRLLHAGRTFPMRN